MGLSDSLMIRCSQARREESAASVKSRTSRMPVARSRWLVSRILSSPTISPVQSPNHKSGCGVMTRSGPTSNLPPQGSTAMPPVSPPFLRWFGRSHSRPDRQQAPAHRQGQTVARSRSSRRRQSRIEIVDLRCLHGQFLMHSRLSAELPAIDQDRKGVAVRVTLLPPFRSSLTVPLPINSKSRTSYR